MGCMSTGLSRECPAPTAGMPGQGGWGLGSSAVAIAGPERESTASARGLNSPACWGTAGVSSSSALNWVGRALRPEPLTASGPISCPKVAVG